MKQRTACLALAVIGLASLAHAQRPAAARAAPKTPAPTEILFQAFPWNADVNGQKHVWYRHVTEQVPELVAAGVTHVWYPPSSRSVAPQGYMPGDLYDLGHGDELGDNRTLYGNLEELKRSLQVMKRRGIVPVMDAVLNHRTASHQEDGVWNVFHHASGKAWWERWALCAGDYGGSGAADSGSDFGAAPDVDHTNPKVREDYLEWLRWMRDEVGFQGVRFDFTKGYAADYAREYAAVFEDHFSVGELWTSMNYDGDQLLPDQDTHRQQLADWVDGTQGEVATFDFTTKGLLQEALATDRFHWLRASDGRARGFLGWWPDRSVTFVDNHDTGSEQGHWPFPAAKVLPGYAYVLTHPGTPTIFWDHLLRWGEGHRETITRLARLRHEQGLNRRSKLEILRAEEGLYAARVDGKVAVKLGSKPWSPGEGYQLALSGHGFAVWTRE
jgi:alpha-amylase